MGHTSVVSTIAFGHTQVMALGGTFAVSSRLAPDSPQLGFSQLVLRAQMLQLDFILGGPYFCLRRSNQQLEALALGNHWPSNAILHLFRLAHALELKG
jgi:hypothetical protein